MPVSEPFVAFLRRIVPPEHVELVVAERADILAAWMRAAAEAEQLREAARAWLKFDNEVEPPGPDAPYADHLAYEQAKAEATEALAAAIEGGGQ
jgi:hypothetical protein